MYNSLMDDLEDDPTPGPEEAVELVDKVVDDSDSVDVDDDLIAAGGKYARLCQQSLLEGSEEGPADAELIDRANPAITPELEEEAQAT